jgi:hypothetical protein
MDAERSSDRLYYDFVLNDVHFIVLDARGKPDPQGFFPPEQAVWLDQTCAASKAESICIALHYLPLRLGIPWYDNDMMVQNEQVFFDAIIRHRHKIKGVFFGHIHRPFTGYRHGMLFSCAPSAFKQFLMWPDLTTVAIDNITPGGYSIVTVSAEQTTIAHHFIPGDY